MNKREKDSSIESSIKDFSKFLIKNQILIYGGSRFVYSRDVNKKGKVSSN